MAGCVFTCTHGDRLLYNIGGEGPVQGQKCAGWMFEELL